MSNQTNQPVRQDFTYRQLENNLIYISDSIVRAIKSGKCEISFWVDDENPALGQGSGFTANLEKSYVEMEMMFNGPNTYLVRVWNKNSSPSERDKKRWYNKTIPCPGQLAWECSDSDDVSEEEMETHYFDKDLQGLVYKYIGVIEQAYLSAGCVNIEIKGLL